MTWGIGNFGLPQLITKFNSCKDEKTARYSQGISGILFVLFYLPLMVIGLGMRILRPGIVQTDTVASIAMVEMVSPLIGGIVLAAILGAAISTAPPLQAGTTATRDIYQKFINPNAEGERVLAISKGTTLTVGIISIVLSLFNSSTVLMIQSNMVGVLGSMLCYDDHYRIYLETVKRPGGDGRYAGRYTDGSNMVCTETAIWMDANSSGHFHVDGSQYISKSDDSGAAQRDSG